LAVALRSLLVGLEQAGSGLLGAVDRSGQLVEVGAEDAQDALERVPADTPLATLDTGYERGVCSKLFGDPFLGHACLVAEFAEGSTEDEMIVRGGWLISSSGHRRNALATRRKVPGSFWPKSSMLLRSQK
jgi:hypothetical protein